jgi:hypothetical protein
MKQMRRRGTTVIALFAVVVALASAPAAGAASVGRFGGHHGHSFGLDASWAEGA